MWERKTAAHMAMQNYAQNIPSPRTNDEDSVTISLPLLHLGVDVLYLGALNIEDGLQGVPFHAQKR